MHPIRLLENPIRRYAWGSRTFLSALQGRTAPSQEPEAELWIGAHPSAPSQVVDGVHRVSLADWIARDPAGVLGAAVAERFAGELPFLVKILAVEAPLSVQAHPDAERARAGFARENARGIPLDAPHRCYRDPRPKPELVCALTPFRALVGLRPEAEVRSELEALDSAFLAPLLSALAERPGPPGLRRALGLLLAWTEAERRERVPALVAAAERSAPGRPASAHILELAQAWPGDPAILAPCFLHAVTLAPGEALFVGPGTLHAYLEGAAVEVQANSDNVLRAGLTGKHVDPDELLEVVRFESVRPRASIVQPEALSSTRFVDEFRCASWSIEGEAASAVDPAVQILLCVSGRVEVIDPSGGRVVLTPGRACFVPNATASYRVSGSGRLFRVAPGMRG